MRSSFLEVELARAREGVADTVESRLCSSGRGGHGWRIVVLVGGDPSLRYDYPVLVDKGGRDIGLAGLEIRGISDVGNSAGKAQYRAILAEGVKAELTGVHGHWRKVRYGRIWLI